MLVYSVRELAPRNAQRAAVDEGPWDRCRGVRWDVRVDRLPDRDGHRERPDEHVPARDSSGALQPPVVRLAAADNDRAQQSQTDTEGTNDVIEIELEDKVGGVACSWDARWVANHALPASQFRRPDK